MKTMKTARPRASLHTLGCRLNQAETALLADRLRADGYNIVDYGRPTDLLVLNTCSVTGEAERICRYEIRRTLRHSPQAFVAVTGCYAQTGVESLRRTPGIDLIVGNQYKMSLPAHLPAPPALAKQAAPTLLHTRTLDREDFTLDGTGDCESRRANLKIQDGCGFMCSFCLIPFARGHERSRRLDDAIREAEALVARGHRELVLTGVNIGQYEQAGGSLLDLIRCLERIDGLDRIRISSIEPTTVSDELLEHMAISTKLCRHLHLPLQSGDNDLLRAMNRRYTVQNYSAFVERAMRLIPDLGLGTDLLVGFPGESEAGFANTLAAAADLPFSYLHVFAYSKRPGTAAAKLASPVPAPVVARRRAALAGLSRARRMAFYQQHVGRTVEVLFETKDDAGRWTGLTGNYMRVGATAGGDLANRIGRVAIEGAMDGLAVGRMEP
jgi:threonylcarbamoyladenosine tRNA methylthiotransferase MtaB